ncbi:MAG: hypothetical protein D6679_13720 [Candidatus Hydrogenedentota bacterium]|nr:MAG: hypothetical protein D6679_13720 [Candidatus Hydrogenedentota bacterium]
MAENFDSIQSLLQQVHAESEQLPTLSPEEQAKAEEEEREARLREEVARFKRFVLEDPGINRRLRKFRREGIYAVRPWQWGVLAVALPLLAAACFYFFRTFTQEYRITKTLQAVEQAVLSGNLKEAERLVENILQLQADPGEIYLDYARILEDHDYLNDAARYYEIARQFARTRTDQSIFIDASISLAEILLRQKEPSEAKGIVDQVLEIDAKNRRALLLEGRVLMLQAQYAEAEEAFFNALERNPASLTPRYYLRELYLRAGQGKKAREQEELLLQARPYGDEDIPTLLAYADLMLNAGKIEEAEKALQDILRKSRKIRPGILVTLGNLAIENDDFSQAEAYADSAILLAPTYAPGYILRGELGYYGGAPDIALKDFQKALELNPRHPKALYDMGCLLLYDLKNYPLARSYFEAADRNGFDGPFFRYNLAVTRMQSGDPEGAIASLSRIPPFLEDHPSVQWAFATAYLLSQKTDSALAHLRPLEQVRHSDPALQNNYGIALELRGDTEHALQRYWNAVRLAPDPRQADSIALSNIQRLLAGKPPTPLRNYIHTELPLRLEGVILPRTTRRTL